MKKNMIRIISGGILSVCICLSCVMNAQASVRIKDIAYFDGARENQLMGYGLVVGLNGTGDKSQSVFTVKSIASLLSRLGIEVNSSQISPKNVAAVMVTATLPPFVKSGARIDVTLSSLGDATSLQGGTLLLTPLQGADGNVYAVAQGQISLGGMDSSGGGKGSSFTTVGRIPMGALIENEVPSTIMKEDKIALLLKKVDFTTCARVAEAINVSFQSPIASSLDGGTISIAVPSAFRTNLVTFLARLEHIEVQPDVQAKIVINERTGTVVGGKEVKISRVSISHKNINVEIKPTEKTEEPALLEEKKTEGTSSLSYREEIFAENEEQKYTVEELDETTIGDVAKLLNTMGVKPADMIAIFQAIKHAGAVQAELEII